MARFSEIRCRCVTVDGQTARRLREERNLSIEQLSINARCSDKTVQALEMGRPKLKSIVERVAKALGIPPEDLKPVPYVLIAPPQAYVPPTNPTTPPRRHRIVVVYELSPAFLEKAPDEIHLVIRLAEGTETTNPIVVLNSEAGSMRLTLDVSEEDALRIVNAFLTGKLSTYGLRSVILLDDAFHPAEPAAHDHLMWVVNVTHDEDGNEFVVKLELPGLDTNATDVQLQENMLTIKAASKQESKEEGQNAATGRYQSYQWTVVFPRDFDSDKVSAMYSNGLLEIRLPYTLLPPQSKQKRIQIQEPASRS